MSREKLLSLFPKDWQPKPGLLHVVASDKAEAWRNMYRTKIFGINAETVAQQYAGGERKIEPQGDRTRSAVEFKINESEEHIPIKFYEKMKILASDVVVYVEEKAKHKFNRQEVSPQDRTRILDEVISWYEKPFVMWWLFGLGASEGPGSERKFAELRLDAQFDKGINPDKIRQNLNLNLPTGYALIEEGKKQHATLRLSNVGRPQEIARPSQALAELLIVNKVMPPELLSAFLTSFRTDQDGNTVIPLDSAQRDKRRLNKYLNPAWRPYEAV
jgi:hypothetical protein